VIEATQDKLDEARFFLSKLRQEKQRQEQLFRTDPKEFRYYVHAFLSAARSVRWVLQCEEPEKYKAWTDIWAAKDNDADKELLKLMNEQRVAVTNAEAQRRRPFRKKLLSAKANIQPMAFIILCPPERTHRGPYSTFTTSNIMAKKKKWSQPVNDTSSI
jgi:hypothetical protein